jgi:hypothetical protein
MNATYDTLHNELKRDFARAHDDLSHAKLRRNRKDSPKNRAAVADCLTLIDTILDVYLENEDIHHVHH